MSEKSHYQHTPPSHEEQSGVVKKTGEHITKRTRILVEDEIIKAILRFGWTGALAVVIAVGADEFVERQALNLTASTIETSMRLRNQYDEWVTSLESDQPEPSQKSDTERIFLENFPRLTQAEIEYLQNSAGQYRVVVGFERLPGEAFENPIKQDFVSTYHNNEDPFRDPMVGTLLELGFIDGKLWYKVAAERTQALRNQDYDYSSLRAVYVPAELSFFTVVHYEEPMIYFNDLGELFVPYGQPLVDFYGKQLGSIYQDASVSVHTKVVQNDQCFYLIHTSQVIGYEGEADWGWVEADCNAVEMDVYKVMNQYGVQLPLRE